MGRGALTSAAEPPAVMIQLALANLESFDPALAARSLGVSEFLLETLPGVGLIAHRGDVDHARSSTRYVGDILGLAVSRYPRDLGFCACVPDYSSLTHWSRSASLTHVLTTTHRLCGELELLHAGELPYSPARLLDALDVAAEHAPLHEIRAEIEASLASHLAPLSDAALVYLTTRLHGRDSSAHAVISEALAEAGSEPSLTSSPAGELVLVLCMSEFGSHLGPSLLRRRFRGVPLQSFAHLMWMPRSLAGVLSSVAYVQIADASPLTSAERAELLHLVGTLLRDEARLPGHVVSRPTLLGDLLALSLDALA